jgi:hypothetical protein
MTPTPWWLPWLGLIGVVLGFILAQGKDWWSRYFRRKSYWAALRAELEFCREQAEIYMKDPYAAPLYRLPVTVYTHSFPALLGDGAVSEEDANALMRFFTEVATLNRGLDLANAARDRNDNNATLQAEVNRNRIKAQRLTAADDGAVNYYAAAKHVIDKHL